MNSSADLLHYLTDQTHHLLCFFKMHVTADIIQDDELSVRIEFQKPLLHFDF